LVDFGSITFLSEVVILFQPLSLAEVNTGPFFQILGCDKKLPSADRSSQSEQAGHVPGVSEVLLSVSS
jgi:hypothetical protein